MGVNLFNTKKGVNISLIYTTSEGHLFSTSHLIGTCKMREGDSKHGGGLAPVSTKCVSEESVCGFYQKVKNI